MNLDRDSLQAGQCDSSSGIELRPKDLASLTRERRLVARDGIVAE